MTNYNKSSIPFPTEYITCQELLLALEAKEESKKEELNG